jgi:hypothetical protein
MRNTFAAALAMAATLLPPARGVAGDRETALALIDRAVTAHGGEAALSRSRIQSRTGSGVLTQAGGDVPFTDDTLLALPDRMRIAVDLNKRLQLTMVVNGDRGWQSTGGMVTELSKERLDELKEEGYVQWLTTLVPVKGEGFTLTPLPEVKVGDKPALPVRVARKGHSDVTLFFDKDNSLLVQIQRRTKEAGLTLDKTYQYSDHKSFDGVKLPTKQVELLNGRKFTELTSATYRILPRADDAAFGKP